MNFEFKFESILKIRRFREQKEQQKLGVLIQQKAALKNKGRTLRKRMQDANHHYAVPRSASVQTVRQKYEQKHDLQNQIQSLRKKRQKIEDKIRVQRKKLLKANKQTKMMEKLKDRHRMKFIEQQQHIEQRQQNEIATQMYNRTR